MGGGCAQVDCDVEKTLCNKHGVQGFPTIKVFQKGDAKAADYDGDRTADGIVSHLRK